MILSQVNRLCAAQQVRDTRRAKEHEKVMEEFGLIKAAVVKCVDLDINWPIKDRTQLARIEKKMNANPLYADRR